MFKKKRKCPKCQHPYNKGDKFCEKCGYDLREIRRTKRHWPTWLKYVGLAVLVLILIASLWYVISPTMDYQAIIHHTYTGGDYQNALGASITDDLSSTYRFASFFLCASLLGLAIVFAKYLKKPRKLTIAMIAIIEVVTIGGVVLNYNHNHSFSLSSSKLGASYTKETLSGSIWRYSYYKDKQDQDTDSGDCQNQITKDVGGNKYSHVFLKFNSDGTLGVNINPYWQDDDQKAYDHSESSDYRTVGNWDVTASGKVRISWDETDTGAYKYETVKVKKKHHKKHHKKYTYKQELTPQFLDSYGNPDTTLPRYFPGDSIEGHASFGIKTLKIDGVLFQTPSKDGSVDDNVR
ncbi:zinc ribbon domain-containing protein [uncultured Limosilactobacillus sp.]|uniref:zinc ribbon domain-containing protein n=1 Tax=uncultured Limosilactobacillus sp. TaxID=2837629 RepID=UPI0025DAF350|nr:zinc ribbon domain-containing protein [uncultured Limosilactobacillus sp.]